MKSLAIKFCVAFLLFSLNVKAQTPDTSTVDKLIRYILQPIDKSQIPTSILAEYGAPLLELSTFNGVLTDSNKVNINIFRTLAYQMQTAYCGSGTSSLPTISTVNSNIASLSHDSLPIPVPLFIGYYNSVKSDAFTNNLLYHNIGTNQVEDVYGRSQCPYQNNYLFAGSPTKNFTVNGKEKFLFSSSLLWNNTGKTISQIQVDFDNTLGYETITIGSPITVSYADTGTKNWIIKVTFTDASTLQCYSNYYVAKADSSNTAARYQPGTGGPFGGGFDQREPFGANANHDGAQVYIAYTNLSRTNTIRKPLIVVEGFDANNSYTYRDFIDAIDQLRAIYDFNNELDLTAGYDIIFVDFNNGTDDIRRNAALLEEVIDWVNDNKVANDNNNNIMEQNVVLGISMGGLVARYALAEMTKNNIATDTRLLVTHDSPHRGANVPLGLQYLIQMAGEAQVFGTGIRDIYADYDQALALLETDAAQQMLIYRSTSKNTYLNNTFLDGEYRTMITFSTNDPQPTYQFLATSNGSQCGTEIFQPHHELINASVGTFAFLFPIVSNRIQVSMSAYALPDNGQTSLLASLSVSNKTKLFGLITVAKQIYDASAYANGTQLPIDGVPGGLSPYQISLGNGSVKLSLTSLIGNSSDALIFSNLTQVAS